ncbi:MAG: WYL domain-containing protein [Bacteroidetes bacterium]|nr:WYL domain-containing protein [Bacteroidota bacterium]
MRYRIIDEMLKNNMKPYPSKEDIRCNLEEKGYKVSSSTIEKDIKAMRDEVNLGFNAPIGYDHDRRGYYYTDKDYSIAEIPLTEDETESIRFAATTLYHFRETKIFSDYKSAIEKILNRVSSSPGVDDKKLHKFLQFESVPYYKGWDYVAVLLNAAQKRLTVEFSYNKFNSDETTHHTVDPYFIKEYRNRWYLIGYSHAKDYFLTFGLGRIEDLQITTKRYTINSYFDPDKFFRHSYGITTHEGKVEKVVLSFSKELAPYIRTMNIHDTQKIVKDTDKEYRISINILISRELIAEILGWGKGVKVISPGSLVEGIKAELESCLKEYL